MHDSHPIFGIGAVGRMLGVPTSTIRAWEERYRVSLAAASPGVRRLYTRQEVERLRFVKELTDDGVQPADAHRLVGDHIRAGASGVSDRRADDATSQLVLVVDRDPHAADLAEHFLLSQGYEVALATDAAEAIDKFGDLSPQRAVVEVLVGGGRGTRCSRMGTGLERLR